MGAAHVLLPWLVMTAVVPSHPPTRRDPVVETLHGETVADPYRWLEDGTSPEVDAWTAAQTAYLR
ncbi:MAG TPA: hypothetical protein VHU40_00020, partial [Polyangia bacterium]|nr:hypothetical protein [Polyangia bacterium]